jgi:hypothetical protein
MRDFYQVGFAAILAFASGGSAAIAQVASAPPASVPAPGASSIDGVGVDDPEGEMREPVVKGVAPSASARRMSRFNRVRTTRKEAVPGPPQAARAASASSAAASASGAAGSGPYTAQAIRDRRAAANSAIPSGSTWRQERSRAPLPQPPTRPVTHNYYPGLRPGLHPNADQAQVRARNGRTSAAAGYRMGIGMGMGMSAGRASAQASRPGTAAIPGRAPAAAAPPRR